MNLSVNDFNNLHDIVAAVLDQLKAVLAANGLDALTLPPVCSPLRWIYAVPSTTPMLAPRTPILPLKP